jgi:hypothetical protein
MIRTILRRVDALEKRYPKPSAGEMANKRVAAYLRSIGWGHLAKALPPTKMDNQQIADFMRSRCVGFLMVGLVPKEYMTQEELWDSQS